MFSSSPRHRNRLPRADLGTRNVPLPDSTTAGSVISVAALYERRLVRPLQFNLPSALVYIRFLKLRREDRADAFSVDQMSQ